MGSDLEDLAARPWGEDDGGIFGSWFEDEWGLPAFEYTLDQRVDDRAEWDTRLFGTSRVHWHQIGNDRVVAIATNEGWVQLYSHEHGPRWINQCRPGDGCFAGGVSYLLDREQGDSWSTFHEDLPRDAVCRRIFGCGYYRVVVQRDDIELDRIVFSPFGESRLLVSQVEVRNRGKRTRQLRHGEFWDVWLSNIDYGIATGIRIPEAPREATSAFTYGGYGAGWDDELGGLRARHPQGTLSEQMPFVLGPTPRTRPDVVLVPLGPRVDGWMASREELLGRGGRARPDGLVEPTQVSRSPDEEGQGVGLLCSTDFELDPGETISFGFAYGAAPPSEVGREVAQLGRSAKALFGATVTAWRDYLPRVEYGDVGWLTRELAWGAYYVRSGATYHEGFRAHTVSQGGAYQYLGGFNAGPRATVQHALPLVWLAPELAAEAARFTMAEATPDGELAYSEVGTGLWEPVNYCPSDNDLWLLWLVSEYVLATRDASFLRQSVSYWPAPYTRPEPVWDHLVRAYEHLLQAVGTGTHGLLKLRLGDWNDVIVAESGVPVERVWEEGESTLNTAMAVYVLRRFAELARYAGEAEMAREALEQASVFAEATRACWRETHLNRGWAANDKEIGYDDLFLEPQPWALIAEVLGEEEQKTLVAEIRKRCAGVIGTRLFGPGVEEGNPPTAGGGQWLSINSTLAWGLGKVDPEQGFEELLANTLRRHADVYPETWFGVWSGPDMYLPAAYGFEEYAGQTWWWPGVFSMQAWPVQILFAHSEPLNASLWLTGIVPDADGLTIDPMLPFDGWTWDGGLLSLTYGPDEVRGELGALAADVLEIDMALPSELRGQPLEVEVSGTRVDHRDGVGRVSFLLPVGPARATPFRITPAP